MGPVGEMAGAIDDARLPAALAVIAGRNRALRAHLGHRQWSLPAFVYGFVDNMPDLMWASDILVTKAGPGTINEAFNAGLPLALYSRLPGQEDGNVSYVVSEGAGVWAPDAGTLVSTLQRWLAQPSERLRTAEASRRLARPQAARQIAHLLVRQVGLAA
jgi:1,2-diacylglycerol 3-beta-galactosyltransferase